MTLRSLIGPLGLFLLCLGGLLTPHASAAQQPTAATADSSGLTVSPRGALLRSFAIPGWGQTYAEAPGRGAIYFGMEATSLWMVYKTARQLTAARERDRWLREKNQTPDEGPSELTRARAQQFEDWVTLAVSVALFSGADAYVTAQLSDFAEQVRVRPGAGSSLEIGFDVPVGWGR